MTEVISFRLSATGVWGYSFYRGGLYLGEAACQIGRASTVRIIGEDIVWYSQFMIDTDIVPGVSRRIKDNMTEKELYRIIFWRPGLYEFYARAERGDWSMTVEERNGMYLFGKSGMPVSAITERIAPAELVTPVGKQAEPAFRTSFFEQEDRPGFLMLVLSFPALKMI